jgi:hypothetical protein
LTSLRQFSFLMMMSHPPEGCAFSEVENTVLYGLDSGEIMSRI